MPEYLNLDEEEKKILEMELREKTTEVETVLNEKVDYKKFEKAVIKGFEEEWEIKF